MTDSHSFCGRIFRLVFLGLVLMPALAEACPYCGFVLRVNEVASSWLYGAIVFLACMGALRFLPSWPTRRQRTVAVLSVLSFVVVGCFYLWPELRPYDVLPYQRYRDLTRLSSGLSSTFQVTIAVMPTATALWLRTKCSAGYGARCVLGIMGFAIPTLWTVTLIGYISPLYGTGGILNAYLVFIWVVLGLLSAIPRAFCIVCRLLFTAMMLSFLLSGAFDDLSFFWITVVLGSFLFATGISNSEQQCTVPEIKTAEKQKAQEENPHTKQMHRTS